MYIYIKNIIFLYIKKLYTEIRKLHDQKNTELKSNKEKDHGGEEQKVSSKRSH